tara:strand:+ start:26 stop:631 length:606 start_codon:yes stop_codon:yes gene_type:complete
MGKKTSRFRGVDLRGTRFRARLLTKGKFIMVGWFETEEEAAHARDDACRKHCPNRAMNFPRDGERAVLANKKANKKAYQRRYDAWYWKNHPDVKMRKKARALKAKYNLTIDEHLAMFQRQGYKCALCSCAVNRGTGAAPEEPKRGVVVGCVDHCHATGTVRAILCSSCNKGLGYVEKRGPAWVKRAQAYLARHAAKESDVQ